MLTGRDGGQVNALVAAPHRRAHLRTARNRTARIQEVHIIAIHCLCDGVDAATSRRTGNPHMSRMAIPAADLAGRRDPSRVDCRVARP